MFANCKQTTLLYFLFDICMCVICFNLKDIIIIGYKK